MTYAYPTHTSTAQQPHVSTSAKEDSKFNAGQPDNRAPEVYIVPICAVTFHNLSMLTWPWLEPHVPLYTPCSKKNSNKWKCFQGTQAKLSKGFKTNPRRNK